MVHDSLRGVDYRSLVCGDAGAGAEVAALRWPVCLIQPTANTLQSQAQLKQISIDRTLQLTMLAVAGSLFALLEPAAGSGAAAHLLTGESSVWDRAPK